jgi:hypothetical protein
VNLNDVHHHTLPRRDERPRLDTPCMNRVMSRSYNVAGANNIYERVIANKVPGGTITSTGLKAVGEDEPELERYKIVDYDVLRWDLSRFGTQPKGCKFNTVELNNTPAASSSSVSSSDQSSHSPPRGIHIFVQITTIIQTRI